MKSVPGVVELTVHALQSNMLPFAILSGLILAAVAVSFVAVLRVQTLAQGMEQRAKAGQQKCELALESLSQSLSALTAEFQELRREPPISIIPGPPKRALNLTKRSQALRMHRSGDLPDQIATALDIPLQEVDLLLKVQRIVIRNI